MSKSSFFHVKEKGSINEICIVLKSQTCGRFFKGPTLTTWIQFALNIYKLIFIYFEFYLYQ